MARALSNDLRERILQDCDAGETVSKVAEKYRVSERTVFKLRKLRRETGSYEPRTSRCGRRPKLTQRREEIERTLRENPSLTLQELISQLSLDISVSALWKTLKRWKLSLKKSSTPR